MEMDLFVAQKVCVPSSLSCNTEAGGHTSLLLLAVDIPLFIIDILPFVIKVGVLKTLDYMYVNLGALTQEWEG